MEELFEWLDRLDAVTPQDANALSESMKRVSSPSPLAFDRSVVRIVDTGQALYPFGQVPSNFGVLAWLDRIPEGQSLGDQALAAQIGALLTLATNRRIQVAASDVTLTMQGSTERTFLPSAHVLDSSLAGPVPADVKSRFEKLAGALYGLDRHDREVIGAATELHYASALLFDLDPNAAYALCVAGTERLSRAYGNAPAEWSAWEDASRLDGVFADLSLSTEAAQRLREEILANRHLRLRQTFASYVTTSLPESFWDAEVESYHPAIRMEPTGRSTFEKMQPGVTTPIGRFVPQDRHTLRVQLLASYDARSSYVHEGRQGAATLVSTLQPMIGIEPERRQPIAFAGLRQILVTLILLEVNARSKSRPLPRIQHVTTDG